MHLLLSLLVAAGVLQAAAIAQPEVQEQRNSINIKREECDSTPEICNTMAAFGGSLIVPQVISSFKVSPSRAARLFQPGHC